MNILGRAKLIELMIQYGANVNAVDKNEGNAAINVLGNWTNKIILKVKFNGIITC